MEKPKFKIPAQKPGRTGRIALFITSTIAVCLMLVRFGNDYISLYSNSAIALPVIAQAAISVVQFINNFWWAVIIGVAALTLVFCLITKSGTPFTILSILVWLAGILGYLALWLPSRALETNMGG